MGQSHNDGVDNLSKNTSSFDHLREVREDVLMTCIQGWIHYVTCFGEHHGRCLIVFKNGFGWSITILDAKGTSMTHDMIDW